jgi:hypothetical protein
MHIPHAGDMMNLLVLVAVLSCLNSGLYVTSRVLFVLSEKGDAPRAGRAQPALGARALDHLRQPVRLSRARRLGAFAGTGVQLPRQRLGRADAVHLPVRLLRAGAPAQPQPTGRHGTAHPHVAAPYISYATAGAILAVLGAMAFSPSARIELVSSLVVLGIATAASFRGDTRARAAA